MELNDGLKPILEEHFDWGKCRLDCFIGMLLGLLRLKQINLTQLASSPIALVDNNTLTKIFLRTIDEYSKKTIGRNSPGPKRIATEP